MTEPRAAEQTPDVLLAIEEREDLAHRQHTLIVSTDEHVAAEMYEVTA